jgi:hypothetical protein
VTALGAEFLMIQGTGSVAVVSKPPSATTLVGAGGGLDDDVEATVLEAVVEGSGFGATVTVEV